MTTSSRLQTFTYFLCSSLIIGYILYIGSTLIIPIVFAILLAVFLNPLENKYRSIFKLKWVSIIFSFLSLILPIILITTLFSYQLLNIMDSLPSIGEGMEKGVERLLSKLNSTFPFLKLDSQTIIPSSESDLKGPLKILGQSLVSTTSIIASTGLVIIYTYLFLYYKESFKNFLIYAFEKENRPDLKDTLNKIKDTIQSYIGGLGLVIIILSVLNTIGLSLIGIDYALFWGTLAGMLAIIPYIGTLMGGMLPFIYALSSAESSWQPYAVIIYYLLIQQIEGNFITPKIVGDKVDINPLFAILSLVFFGTFWGIGGIILALPLISIVKIVLSQFESTYSYAVLMSSDINSKKGIFKRLARRR